jgi:hypothetical protein
MGNYTKPRFGAIAAGTLCALGAAAVLVEDVRHTQTVTLDHLLAVIVLVGTIAAGVMAVGMLRSWRTWHYAAALVALAGIGSVYCMMGTAGRTAETRATARLEAEARETRRGEILAARAKDQERLDRKREEHAAECKSGKGTKCNGILESLKVYEAAVKGHNADLAELGPEVPVNTRVKNAAAILAAIRGADGAQQARIEATLTLIEPNIPALFLEAGSIVFLHIGLAGVVWAWPWKRQARPQAAIGKPAEEMSLAELAALQHLFRDDEPTPPRPGRRAKPAERRRQVADFRAAFVKKHGHEPQPADIRAALGFPRRASHSYLREQVPA